MDFASLKRDFATLKADDSFENFCGFVFALCAHNLQAGQREFNSRVAQIYNDDLPLPGTMIAVATNLALEARSCLEGRQPLPLPFDGARDNCDKLSFLGEFAYGMALGIGLFEGNDFRDELQMLSAISTVDPDTYEDDESFETLTDFMQNLFAAVYDKECKKPNA